MTRSDFEMAYSLYSDIFKDVNNFRPRNHAKWERLGLDALNAEIDNLTESLEAILETEREEGAKWYDLEPIDCPHLEAEYLADLEAEEWAEDERQIARDAQKVEEAQELQWVQWEVLEMNLMGLRHR